MSAVKSLLLEFADIPQIDENECYNELSDIYDRYPHIVQSIAEYVFTLYPNNAREILQKLYPEYAEQVLSYLNNPDIKIELNTKSEYLRAHYRILLDLNNRYGFETLTAAVKQWHDNYSKVSDRISRLYELLGDLQGNNPDNLYSRYIGLSDDGTYDFSRSIAFNQDEVDYFLHMTDPEVVNEQKLQQLEYLFSKHLEDYYYIQQINQDDVRLIH